MAFFYSDRFLRKNPTFPQSAYEVMFGTSYFKCPVGTPFADGDIIWMDMIPYGCNQAEHLISFGSKYSLDTTGTAVPVVDPAHPWDATLVFPNVAPVVIGYPWQEAHALDPKIDTKWKQYQVMGLHMYGAGGPPQRASGYIVKLVLKYINVERERSGFDFRVQPNMTSVTPPPYFP